MSFAGALPKTVEEKALEIPSLPWLRGSFDSATPFANVALLGHGLPPAQDDTWVRTDSSREFAPRHVTLPRTCSINPSR